MPAIASADSDNIKRRILNARNKGNRYLKLGKTECYNFSRIVMSNLAEHGVETRPGDIVPAGYGLETAIQPTNRIKPKVAPQIVAIKPTATTTNDFNIYTEPVVDVVATRKAVAEWDGTGEPPIIRTERTLDTKATARAIAEFAIARITALGISNAEAIAICSEMGAISAGVPPAIAFANPDEESDADDEAEEEEESEAEVEPEPEEAASEAESEPANGGAGEPKPKTARKCGKCGEPGHNAKTCKA
jgi:hypothetical protein